MNQGHQDYLWRSGFPMRVLTEYLNRLERDGRITIHRETTHNKYSGTPGVFVDVPIDTEWVAQQIESGLRSNDIQFNHTRPMDHDWGDGTHGRFDGDLRQYEKIY